MIILNQFITQIYQNYIQNQPYPNVPEKDSILAKTLTPEIYDKMKKIEDKSGFSFQQLIGYKRTQKQLKSGQISQIQAGSSDSYNAFKEFLDQVVEQYHNFKPQDHQKNTWGDLESLELQDLNQKHHEEFLLSMNISLVRNINNHSFPAGMTCWQRKKFEENIKKIIGENLKDLKYFSLKDLKGKKNYGFEQKNLQYEDHGRFETGRGVFVNEEENFIVWVNENDQLTFKSFEKGGNFKKCIQRLIDYIKALKNIDFAYSERFGFLSGNPANLGTGITFEFIVKIPWECKDQELLKKNLHKAGLEGKKLEKEEDVYKIWNQKKLGLSENQLITDIYNAINSVIQNEKFARSSRYNE
ncbi:hypothetical protein IMG5_161300 [Ichthyophthirius multifiliis]|uniref:Arginine kinase n=1 Tax=Ichthyophthirius multifiliis TaxID=5932 RepID=G0R022_ICHMU|nr:hypothetical protein IMG5_161300 [Ichthyophthirius multifiliis]EGR29180.1 hypothetical protein IMG5_161300 [Ichthyophthirius multifiliis]|eukprot:XP_004030416.1 hypothetical protein IMG5_161300 [Ichthyophthirius multifiliis]